MGSMAALGTANLAQGASNREFKGYPDSFAVLHDITRCIGCRKCEVACNEVNQLGNETKALEDLRVLEQKRRTQAAAYTVVNQFGKEIFAKIQCNHCQEPACASACFVKALKKDKTGAVVYDESLCVGCRYCMVACPFNIPAYTYDDPITPKITKCTLCQPRILEGKLPGCVEACPKEALVFGTRKDLLKEARRRIAAHPDHYQDHIYGEHEMGGTAWLYLSQHPFEEMGMREDLGTQSAPELTAGALSTVPMVVGLWPLFLVGAHAISKRREKIAQKEKEAAVNKAVSQKQEEMEKQITELKTQLAQKGKDE